MSTPLQKLRWIWDSMKRRCSDPRVKQYADYGGRGIFVCERWLKFENFLTDMGNRPPGKSMMDRIDNDGPYSPENCRWVYHDVSNSNRGWCIMVNGKTLKQYMRDTGQIHRYRMVAKRIKKGMAVDEAITKPSRVWPSGHTTHA